MDRKNMSNFPAVMSTNDLSSALANSQVQETNQTGGTNFLKMDFETGEWFLGQDQDEVTGEEILVNTTTICHGWILWSGGRPQKSMINFAQPLPMPMESIGGDSPSEGRSFQGALMDDGSPLAFDTNSYGGRKGVDALLGLIKGHAASGSQHLYPKVKLSSESYANKNRGGKLVFNPIFEIIAWCDVDGNQEDGAAPQVEDKSEEAEDAAPKRQRRSRKAA